MLKINPLSNITFGRRLKNEEKKEYQEIIEKSYELLDKEVDIIVHNSTAPSAKGKNTGIGTLTSENVKANFVPFIKMHGISAIQVEPDGLRQDPSPYTGGTFAKNEFIIPLDSLTSEEYGNILSKETYQKIVDNRPDKSRNKVDFAYVTRAYNEALTEAYENFKVNQPQGLVEEFENFKAKKAESLEVDKLYSVLSKIHENNYYKNWPELDANLFSPKKGDEELASARIEELNTEYKDEGEYFLFKQMLIAKSRENLPIKTIGDAAVAFSSSDVWGHKELFMDGWSLGCPPDYFSKEGQAWDFAVLDPEKMFNEDGTLGESGKFLYAKYKTLFEDNPGGVRIDHIIGLIDPFVYRDKPTSESSGRMYSAPDNPELAKFHKKTTEQYASILEKIVIPAAKSVGLSSDFIICEDLGDFNLPTNNVMEALKLRGIAVTEFANPNDKKDMYRGKNVPPQKIIMAGSHDNDTLINWTKGIFENEEQVMAHAKVLSRDLMPKNAKVAEKDAYAKELASDEAKFRSAKFAELFTSPAKKVQIFFADFFGMDKRYNLPGTPADKNWNLRIPTYFEASYHKNLESGKGVNLPEVLEIAIKQKGKKFAQDNKELLDKLVEYKNILKESE